MASKKSHQRSQQAALGRHQADLDWLGKQDQNAMEKYPEDGFVIILRSIMYIRLIFC